MFRKGTAGMILDHAKTLGVRFTHYMRNIKISCVLLISLGMSSCSIKKHEDLSHYGLLDYRNQNYCDYHFQCKVIGYGIAGACGPHYEGRVSGYLVYSTSMGKHNVRRLKELVKASRVKGKNNEFDYSRFDSQLEECIPAQRLKPRPKCVNKVCK